MTAYILRRFVQLVWVLFGVSTLLFFVMRLAGGDPVYAFLPPEATADQVARLRETMGFNRPLPEQYFDFLRGAVTLDFGDSVIQRRPAMEIALERVPATLEIGIVALIISVALAIPLGVLSAVHRRGTSGYSFMIFALIGQSLPNFWFALLAILLFSVVLGWLPSYGRGGVDHLILPAIALALTPMAVLARVVRSVMLDILSQDYIRTAHAKGLGSRTILVQHALRNAMVPVLTLIGLEVARLLAGSVVIETVFSWPGIGQLLLVSINSRDYSVVQAIIFLIALGVVLSNLFVDIAYAFVDPRIKSAT